MSANIINRIKDKHTKYAMQFIKGGTFSNFARQYIYFAFDSLNELYLMQESYERTDLIARIRQQLKDLLKTLKLGRDDTVYDIMMIKCLLISSDQVEPQSLDVEQEFIALWVTDLREEADKWKERADKRERDWEAYLVKQEEREANQEKLKVELSDAKQKQSNALEGLVVLIDEILER